MKGICLFNLIAFFIIVAIVATIGGICFDYCLFKLFQKDVPWFIDGICGLVASEIVIPLAIILWLLSFFIAF